MLYEIALLGYPTNEQAQDVERLVSEGIKPFGLSLAVEVGWSVRPLHFNPSQKTAASAAFFGGIGASDHELESLIGSHIPIIPVVSTFDNVGTELPAGLKSLNSLSYSNDGPQRVATALLECAGLLPRQRRVFISYRRGEAREAALQLFDSLSARLYDVFLDTHGIAPAEEFQAVLWHHLCDSDVLIMLDTATYFESRWSAAEFGRALAKQIMVLRIGWPNCTPSPRVATATQLSLSSADLDSASGRLSDEAIERIRQRLEIVRSQAIAIRHLNLMSGLRRSIEQIGGKIEGIGANNAVFIKLADGRRIVGYTTVGVPTSVSLHEATMRSPNDLSAIIFDHIGLHPNWLEHLTWLGKHIRSSRWIRASEAAWVFADWEA